MIEMYFHLFSSLFPFQNIKRLQVLWNFLPGLSVHDLEKGSNAFQRDVVSKEGEPHESWQETRGQGVPQLVRI